MTDSSTNNQPAIEDERSTPAVSSLSVLPGQSTGARSVGYTTCAFCGCDVQTQEGICPECGEALNQAPKLIQCMQCGQQASSELVICPGCGRELRATSSRFVTVALPALLAVLLLLFLGMQVRTSGLLTGMQARVSHGITLLQGLGRQLEPEVVIVMTPIAGESSLITDSVAMGNNADGAQEETTAVSMAIVTPTATLSTAANELAALGIGGMSERTRESMTEVATIQADSEMSQPASTASAPLTADTPLPTAAPTQMPSTPTPAREVEPEGLAAAMGETSSTTAAATPQPPQDTSGREDGSGADASIAAVDAAGTAGETENGAGEPLPTPTPDAANAESGDNVAGVASVAQAGGSAGPTPTRTATPVAYQVRSGDTLISIAADYAVTVDALMSANNIDDRDAFVIQPGQLLIIPQIPSEGESPTTEEARAADTDSANGATPVDTDLRVDAPVLLLPSDGAALDCSESTSLSWQRVQFVKDSDKYLLHLGFVNGQNAEDNAGNDAGVTWILAQPHPVTQTSWQMDTSLCDLAPESGDAPQWRWWVEVVEEREGQFVSVSPPSVVRSFSWE